MKPLLSPAPLLLILALLLITSAAYSQQPAEFVNVFMGSAGDHGQMSPAASAPFAQLNVAPQTFPHGHTGYEYYAKQVTGFTHNRFEGVGCMGSGGLILVQPTINGYGPLPLTKKKDVGSPGYYALTTTEGVGMAAAVIENYARENYTFYTGNNGFEIDLSHAFNSGFVSQASKLSGNIVSGKIRAKTTCSVGIYTVYYAMQLPPGKYTLEGNRLTVQLTPNAKEADISIAFSAVGVSYAQRRLEQHRTLNFLQVKQKAEAAWNEVLNTIKISGGTPALQKQFYSLLYRTMQSPYIISEADGSYNATDGITRRADGKRYHGWAIWDNYKTQLPLLALTAPGIYQDIANSVAALYQYGKHDFAGNNEPANTVRSEHAAVVLADALAKGFKVNVTAIQDSLLADTARFDTMKPDKALEACYDWWAMARLVPNRKQDFLQKAAGYKQVWIKNFSDMDAADADRMGARNMYQGTLRQYRWNVPYDLVGLREVAGGKDAFTRQLDYFFDGYNYNRANEPDMQSPLCYYVSSKPWKYQQLVHALALDTIVQFYFNDNSKGIDAHTGKIYYNAPAAYVRTMDDDAGAMSSWWILSAMGLQQPLPGTGRYYLSVPFFTSVAFKPGKKVFEITTNARGAADVYIKKVTLNGVDLGRLWITHEELKQGGRLYIEAGSKPTKYGINNIWVPAITD